MSLKNLSIQTRFFILIVVILIATLVTHSIYLGMLSRVRINSKLYDQIILNKNLSSDLIPPALFLQRLYIAANGLLVEEDINKRPIWYERIDKMEADFQKANAVYDKALPAGLIRDAVIGKVVVSGREMLRLVKEQILIPLQGGKKGEEVQKMVAGPLKTIYEKHQKDTEEALVLIQAEIRQDEIMAQETLQWWFYVLVITGLIIISVKLGLIYYISQGIMGPTNLLMERMKDMSEGATDLTKRVPVQAHDEIGQLSGLINKVIQRIHDLIARVRVSTIQLNSTSTQIAASASEQNATIQNFTSSTSEIAAAVKEISATTQELRGTMEEVRNRADETSTLAGQGRTGLQGMENVMKQLADATGSISSKLGMIREKAEGINLVVATITKVADQTNLLSINAAIEAEKAGEAGRGFLVVAREIRRLADQTAVATLDIEQLVRHMQSAVSGGVMEMDKFSEQVRTCSGRTSEITNQIGQIIEQVESLGHRFQVVNEGMRQQGEGTKQIDEAMLHLDSGVKQVCVSAREFSAAADNLRESTQGLQREVGQFTVAG